MELLEEESKWMDNSQKVCDMLLAEYQQIAKLPNERAANALRYLLTLGLNTDVQTTTPETSAHATESALSVAKNSPGRTTVSSVVTHILGN